MCDGTLCIICPLLGTFSFLKRKETLPPAPYPVISGLLEHIFSPHILWPFVIFFAVVYSTPSITELFFEMTAFSFG
jgi:hypothetical protein